VALANNHCSLKLIQPFEPANRVQATLLALVLLYYFPPEFPLLPGRVRRSGQGAWAGLARTKACSDNASGAPSRRRLADAISMLRKNQEEPLA
jgi:hypothetical protein